MVRLILALSTILTASTALAADIPLNSGNYTHSQYFYGANDVRETFTINKSGTKIDLLDNKNNLRYQFDLSDLGYQDVPDSYLSYIRNRQGSRVLGRMIKRIYLNNLHQVSHNKLAGVMNLELESRSTFGTINTELKVGVSAASANCVVKRFASTGMQDVTTSCLTIETGDIVELTRLQTGLGASTDRVIGLAIDFALKVFSPLFSIQEKLYNNPI